MFGALRRCPTSLSKSLFTSALSTRAIRSSIPRSTFAISRIAPQANNVAIAAFHQSTKWRQVAATEAEQEQEQDLQDEPITEFKELARRGLVHPNIINTITKPMRLQTMTDVQTRTINEALSGIDIIAQAKTGTGKTLGFLIPIVQRIIESEPKLAERVRGYKRARADDVRAIIISPTRELAEQIAVEARKVTSGTGIIVQTAVGGTQKRAMLQKTQREGCHLLIGTPGRLMDILSDSYSGVAAPKLSALCMDEADRLLDDGFQKEIDEIKTHLPDPEEVERQTLMFSATVPRNVVELVRRTLKPGFHFAKCVSDDEEPTHQRIPQKVVHLAGFENTMPALYEFATRESKQAKLGNTRPFKAIIYFNSTAEVTLAASVFFKLSGGLRRDNKLHGLRAFEIHSKLSQSQRTRAADNFRFADSGILFSSDVTARGMDFPNVTHVIQVGLPRDRDVYIHRLGRTGRAGKEGEGMLLLSPLERSEVRRRLRDLPLKEDQTLESATVDMSEPSEVPEEVASMLQEVVQVYKKVYPDQLDAAFRGLFGSFQWYHNKRELLESANRLAEFGWGMPEPPQPPSSLYDSGRGGRSRAGGGGFGRSRPGGFQPRGTMFDGRSGDGNTGGRHGGARFNDRRAGGDRFNDRRTGGDRFNDRRTGNDRFDDRRTGSGRGSNARDQMPAFY